MQAGWLGGVAVRRATVLCGSSGGCSVLMCGALRWRGACCVLMAGNCDSVLPLVR